MRTETRDDEFATLLEKDLKLEPRGNSVLFFFCAIQGVFIQNKRDKKAKKRHINNLYYSGHMMCWQNMEWTPLKKNQHTGSKKGNKRDNERSSGAE